MKKISDFEFRNKGKEFQPRIYADQRGSKGETGESEKEGKHVTVTSTVTMKQKRRWKGSVFRFA